MFALAGKDVGHGGNRASLPPSTNRQLPVTALEGPRRAVQIQRKLNANSTLCCDADLQLKPRHFVPEGGTVIKLRPRWKRWKTWLTVPAVTITASVGLAVPKHAASDGARTRGSAARRRRRQAGLAAAITAATLALASIAFVGAPAASASTPATVSRPASAGVPGPVRQGVNTLIGYFDGDSGLIGGSWWQAAVALSTLETYWQAAGYSSSEIALQRPLVQPFLMYKANNFENNLDDDTAWWGLTWLQAYNLTHYTPYLDTAKNIANYIHQDWNTTKACGGGGVWWKRSPHHAENAIANELYLELTAWLHNTIVENHVGTDSGKNSYLSWAMQEWTWFQRVGMISNGGKFTYDGKPYTVPLNLVTDGITNPRYDGGACSDGNIAPNIYTYNQGVILAGLAQLYVATNHNPMYLTKAEHIASAVLKPPTPLQVVDAVVNSLTGKPSNILTFAGVLNEPTDPLFSSTCCLADGAAFKGIFVRDLKTLAVIADTTQYNNFFKTQSNAIEDVDTTEVPGTSHYRWFGFHWTGPPEPYNTATQASGLDALVAALPRPSSG